jgi:hypothetical protein
MSKGLKYQLFKAVNVDTEKQNVKMLTAQPIHKNEKGKFMVFKKFGVVQADLIYMRDDPAGYKYILTVVDVATRVMDAIPLRGREAYDVIEGFEQVFKHTALYTDPGTEFKNKQFHDYMNEKNIPVYHSMTNRKGQMGIVEYYNHLITRTLGMKMTTEELNTKEEYNNWAEILPKIVEVLNKKENLKVPQLSEFFKEPRMTVTEEKKMLQEGTVVHVRLQAPKDHLADKNNKLHGGFRNGDVRWELDCTEINNVVILPNQPIRYMVKKYPNVSFMRKELLLADASEITEYRQKHTAKEKPKPVPKIDPATHTGVVTRRMAKSMQQ